MDAHIYKEKNFKILERLYNQKKDAHEDFKSCWIK